MSTVSNASWVHVAQITPQRQRAEATGSLLGAFGKKNHPGQQDIVSPMKHHPPFSTHNSQLHVAAVHQTSVLGKGETRLYHTAAVQYNAKIGRMMRESVSSLKLHAVYCIKHDQLTISNTLFLSSSRRECGLCFASMPISLCIIKR